VAGVGKGKGGQATGLQTGGSHERWKVFQTKVEWPKEHKKNVATMFASNADGVATTEKKGETNRKKGDKKFFWGQVSSRVDTDQQSKRKRGRAVDPAKGRRVGMWKRTDEDNLGEEGQNNCSKRFQKKRKKKTEKPGSNPLLSTRDGKQPSLKPKQRNFVGCVLGLKRLTSFSGEQGKKKGKKSRSEVGGRSSL